MAEKKLPYVVGYGNIGRVLQKIQTAPTPSRFTHDFLATKLGMSGGSARSVIPFLKRTGFLGTDGAPTQLYVKFRGSDAERGAAAATALRTGYKSLYEINEYAHELDETGLKALAVQATGRETDSRVVTLIVKSFKALDAFADHDAARAAAAGEVPATIGADVSEPELQGQPLGGLNLGYTINLHLPATSDIAVFDAIFKSLREHVLR